MSNELLSFLAISIASAMLPACSATAPPTPAGAHEKSAHSVLTDAERNDVLAMVSESRASEAHPSIDVSAEPSQPTPMEEPPLLALGEPPSDVHRQLESIRADIASGKLVAARAKLTRLLSTLRKAGTIDEVLTATSLLGRAYDRGGMRSAAAKQYAAVVMLWEADPHFSGIPLEDKAKLFARKAQALSATGEALFFQAERVGEGAEALRLPTGPRSRYRPPTKPLQDMTQQEFEREMDQRKAESEVHMRYINSSVKGWIETKRSRIEEAEKAYHRLMDLQPAPPPIWLVAAGARVGTLWSDFANALGAIPMPAWMSHDPELVRVFRQNLEHTVEPIRKRARSAFHACKQAAETYRVKSEPATVCEAWLRANPSDP